MSKSASLLGDRQEKERNLGSSYFCSGFGWLVLCYCLMVGFFLFVFILWFCLFVGFFKKYRGCRKGKPINKKPLAFLQPAHRWDDKAVLAGVV